MPTETPVVDPKANGAAPVVDAAAAAAAAPAKVDPPSVDVSSLVTELERAKTGMKGLRGQFEKANTKAEAFETAIKALEAGGDPEAILAAAEKAGINSKVIENFLVAAAAKHETPEKKQARELEKRVKAVEEREAKAREAEEAREAEAAIGELSASLAEELKGAGLPILSKMPDEAARDLIGRAAVWRAERLAAGEEPSYEDFVAKVNELANEDAAEYVGGVVDAISMMDREAAQQNKPLVEALAKIGFVPQQNEPAGKNERPAATAAHSRVLTDDLTAERGGADAPDTLGPRIARARAREAEIFRRS